MSDVSSPSTLIRAGMRGIGSRLIHSSVFMINLTFHIVGIFVGREYSTIAVIYLHGIPVRILGPIDKMALQ